MALSASSITAAKTATYRAQHQHVDAVRIFDDPFAEKLLGDAAVEPTTDPTPESVRGRAGLRAFLATRARYAEDLLAHAVAHGAATYIVLGAGLDTFALRNPFPELSVVEIDHPATQAWKRERYAAAGLAVPASLRFCAVDFNKGELCAALDAISGPTFVSWLGVSYYLHREALDATFAAVSSLADRGRTELVLDYSQHGHHLDEHSQRYLDIVKARVEKDGEPFVSFFTADELARMVEAHGFQVLENVHYADVYQRISGEAAPEPRGFGALAHLRCG